MPEQGFQLGQSQTQNQVLSPQMQQSLQVLQVPAMELQQIIREELSVNPTLEQDSTDISLDEEKPGEDDFDREFAELSQLDQEWREYMAQANAAAPRSHDADQKRQYLFDSLVESESLQRHLIAQLHEAGVSDELRSATETLIGELDDRGYLLTEVDELALALALPVAPLEEAFELLRTFEPPGITARDLQDCLLLQLARQGKENSLETRIVEGHLDELARHRYGSLAKRLGVPVERIHAAAEQIATLDPAPGTAYAALPSIYITPDVEIAWDGERWAVTVLDEHIPHLRISNTYKDLLSEASSKGEVRSYIREKIRSGKFLIRSLHQRQDTIRRVAEEIVARQADFFEHGPEKLRPLKMAEIAEAVDVHETTVSRAVGGKYARTPHGVFELRSFFTSGYETAGGDTLSNTSVKGTIAEIVKAEDPAKPLSDEAIMKELGSRGIKVARRTIAKYRDALRILPSHLRRGG